MPRSIRSISRKDLLSIIGITLIVSYLLWVIGVFLDKFFLFEENHDSIPEDYAVQRWKYVLNDILLNDSFQIFYFSCIYVLPILLISFLLVTRRLSRLKIYTISLIAIFCSTIIHRRILTSLGYVPMVSIKTLLEDIALILFGSVIIDFLTRRLFVRSEIPSHHQSPVIQKFKQKNFEEPLTSLASDATKKNVRNQVEDERDPLATTFPFSYLTGEAALRYNEEGRPEQIGLLLQETGHYEISLDTFGKARHVKKHETTRTNANERVLLVFEQMGIAPEAGSELVIKKQGLSGEERIPL